jgi:MFS family permease
MTGRFPERGGLVNQEQPRRLAGTDAGVLGAESCPPRSAHLALVVSSALCAQAASHQAHADVATPTPVDRMERANKWVVLALAGTAAFMTTLDSSIVNIGLPSIARSFGVPLSGSIEWVMIGYLVVIAAVLLTCGRLADRVGSWWLAPLGLAIACVGLLLLSGLTQVSSTGYLILCLIVAAVGQGLFMSPNARALMGAAPAEEQGVASGVLSTTRVVGQSLSVAVGGAVFTSVGGAAAGTALAAGRETLRVQQVLQHTFVAGLHAAFVVCAALAAVGVVTALVRGKETS